MLLTMVFPVPVRAATIEDIEEETGAIVYANGDDNTTEGTEGTGGSTTEDFTDENKEYIIVSEDGKAAHSTGVNWGDRIKFSSDSYIESWNNITTETAKFKINKVDASSDGTKEIEVKISGYAEGIPEGATEKKQGFYELRTEDGQEHGWIDGKDERKDNTYIIKKTEDNKYIIKEAKRNDDPSEEHPLRYATINNNDEFSFLNSNVTEDKADRFIIKEAPECISISSDITIQNASSKKYIKTYSDAGTALTVDGEENDKDILFKQVKFRNTGDGTVVASFISKEHNKGINAS